MEALLILALVAVVALVGAAAASFGVDSRDQITDNTLGVR
jgi:hypothetical protein